MKTFLKLIVSLAIPQLVGFAGSIFTMESVDAWYKTIEKPYFTPPDWIFGPVWATLFVLMGIAFFLVWQKDFGGEKKAVLKVFGFQLFLNLLWSLFFFGLHSPALALIEILILLLAIAANIIVFKKVSKWAGYLLIPYFLWVSFATVLNISIFILN